MTNTTATKRSILMKLAHAVRIISVPPVMVAILIVLLFTLRDDIFASTAEMVVSLSLLAILPILAYPLSVLIPSIRKKGRDGQRSLAMYLSALGYVAVFVYGLVAGVGNHLLLVYSAYLLSVIIILVLNKICHIRASGHACSVTGPLVFTAYLLGIWGIIVGTILWGVILWASLLMKRHTVKEFLLGTATCLVAFTVSLLAITFIG